MNQPSASRLLDAGTASIGIFLSGPSYWATLPEVKIRPEDIFKYQMLALNAPNAVSSTFVEGQRALAHLVIDQAADALAEWAKDHDRPDILSTVSERLEKAVLASDEP